MDDARDLGLAPALLDMQRADDIRPLLAAVDQAPLGHVGAAAGTAESAGAFRRDRRRKAAAERSGVGHQVRLVEAFAVRRGEVRPVVAAAGERIERLRLTGGDPCPGQVARVEIGEGAGVVEPVAHFRVEVEVADQRPVGGVRGDIKPEVGAGRPSGRVSVESRVELGGAGRDQHALGVLGEARRGHDRDERGKPRGVDDVARTNRIIDRAAIVLRLQIAAGRTAR